MALGLCLGMGLGSGAFAQSADPATPGSSFGGMRGTVDATSPDIDLPGFAPPTSDLTGFGPPKPQARSRMALPDTVHMRKMRNTALPERTPVDLTALQAYPKSLRRSGGPLPDTVPNTNVAMLPVLPHKLFTAEAAPFAPVGYPLSSIRVFPYVQQSIGYDSNPEQISTSLRPSFYSRTEGGLALQSNWSSQELRGTMYGAYDEFFSNPNANRPDANGVLDYTITATRDTTIDSELRFNVDTQRPGSPELTNAVVGRPLTAAYGVTLGGTEAFGRFSIGLHGLIDRSLYEDGVLADGKPIDLAYQDLTDYGAKLRVGYDLRPGFAPYVELGGDTRVYDETVDIYGYRRDSDGVAARIGSTFEMGPTLTGTASAGYADRFYEDRRLRDLAGPVADGSIVWAPTPLTTVTLNGATSFNETTVPGASGIESRLAGLAISHALLRNLTLTGAVIYQNNDYLGSDIVENILTESLKAEYHVSRSIVLTGTLSHQTLDSTIPAYGYSQNVAVLGLRLQH